MFTILIMGIVTWLPKLVGSDIYTWLGLLLFISTAILMTYVNARFHLINQISYLPALCYILLIGGVEEIHLFNPALFAAILLITGFIILSDSFKSERQSYSFFIVPAIISCTTFFYQYMYFYMLVVWLVIALLRPGYWREWVYTFLGFAFPIFIAFSWFFLVDDDFIRICAFFNEIFAIQRTMPVLSISSIFFMAFCTILVIVAFVHVLWYVGSEKVIIRNIYYVLFLMVVITVGKLFVVPQILPQAWYLLAFPMSFILSNYLATTKSKLWGTIVLSLLLAGVVANQIFLFSKL